MVFRCRDIERSLHLVFFQIFTNVWGYVEPVSPWFRNKFWLPYLLLAGGTALLIAASGIIVVVLAVLTAIGAAGVPGGSLPLMMLVMATVGVPPEGIAIILGVDRILDMSRTTLNVCGDISAAVYVDRVDREMEGLPPRDAAFAAD